MELRCISDLQPRSWLRLDLENIVPNTASQLRAGLLQNRSAAWQAVAVLLGTLFLTLSSYIVVPMVPVPMTMQTFAVTMVGALFGWRLGAATIIAWLVEGAIGFPVLAGGTGGLFAFMGPTAGYLFAFPAAGAHSLLLSSSRRVIWANSYSRRAQVLIARRGNARGERCCQPHGGISPIVRVGRWLVL